LVMVNKSDTARALLIDWPYSPPMVLSGNARPKHWAVKDRAKRQVIDSVTARMREAMTTDLGPYPWGPVTVQYTSYWCGKAMDNDNFITGMKYPLDALKGELIPDDDPEHVTILKVRYQRVAHRDAVRTVIEVIERDKTRDNADPVNGEDMGRRGDKRGA
jgi:hypothetical protein